MILLDCYFVFFVNFDEICQEIEFSPL